MIVEGIQVQNYRVLGNVSLIGVPRMAVFVGANGSGKSTLLDVFGFIQDSVRTDVNEAVKRRGGVKEVLSRNGSEVVSLWLSFRFEAKSPRLVYQVQLERVEDYLYVLSESLWETSPRRKKPLTLLSVDNGKARAMVDSPDAKGRRGTEYEEHEFENIDVLAIDALGQFKSYATVSRFRQAIQEWHCTTEVSRRPRNRLVRPSPQSLTPSAGNLVDFAQYLHTEHRVRFDEVVRKMRKRVPGLKDVEPFQTEDGRTILRFADGSFEDPFPLGSVSEGTRRLFAILLMLHEPEPHSLLTYEEPENDLYPDIVWPLAEEFRAYADRGSQVLVSTHSPDFVNALNLDEVYWMEKRDGYATVVRAADDPNVRSQNEGGGLMGLLWREGFFGKADPR